MSWEVEGVRYSGYAEYQRALQERDLRRASARVVSMQAEIERNRRRVEEAEEASRRAQGNYERQLAVNQQLDRAVGDLERSQGELRSAQQSLRSEMDHNFQQVRQCQKRTEQELAELDAKHEEHCRLVSQQFDQVERDLQAGLALAETKRRETEARLQASIQQVDRKVEADRAERLKKAQGQQRHAEIQIQMVEEMAARHEKHKESLHLEAEVDRVKEQLLTAGRLLKNGEPTGALSTSEAAFTDARVLDKEAARRTARLETARQYVLESCKHLRSLLQDDVVRKYYEREVGMLEAYLAQLEQRAGENYQRYDRLPLERERDEKLLKSLERETLAIVREAPDVRALFIEREEHIKKMLTQLRSICGALSEVPAAEFADPQDRKSERILRCNYGGVKIDLFFRLDPAKTFRLHSHGYIGNSDCAAGAMNLTRRLAELTGQSLSQPRVDANALNRPVSRDVQISDSRETLERLKNLERN